MKWNSIRQQPEDHLSHLNKFQYKQYLVREVNIMLNDVWSNVLQLENLLNDDVIK